MQHNMIKRRELRSGALIGLLGVPGLLLATMPGCIVGEIRDDLKSANARLGTVDQNLASTTEKLGVVERNLAETNTKLATANDQLTGVGGGLGTTNSSLTQLEEQLRLLESIDKSMVRLDAHLASLRGTIARIDSTIPFLDLGGDAPVEPIASAADPAAEETTQTDPSSIPPAQPGNEPTADRWIGPWVSADPSRTWTLVLMTDGQYIREESFMTSFTNGAQTSTTRQTRVELGTWQRQDKGPSLALVLTPQDNPQTANLRVLHETSRTLSLSTSEGPRVLRRP